MGKIDWTRVLDLKQAESNLRREFYGDWYNDPWGWPELRYMASSAQETLTQHLDNIVSRSITPISVPKEGWGTRPAVVLDIVDRFAYQALVDNLSVDLIGDLSSSVYGWRLPVTGPSKGCYSHQDIQWHNYRAHISDATFEFEVGLTSDIASCFANINTVAACSLIQDKTPRGRVPDALVELLTVMSAASPRRGLPQRSTASAVIANAFLSVLDVILSDHAKESTMRLTIGAANDPKDEWLSFVRWMDDMWLFGDNEGDLRSAQRELQAAAESIGLSLNTAKTAVYSGDELRTLALSIEHSAVDLAIANEKDLQPLEELVDRVLQNPTDASRTTIKFAVNRMIKTGSKYRKNDLLDLCLRMPHAADAVARLLERRFPSAVLQEWFIASAAESSWWQYEWSTAYLLRMFPSSSKPSPAIMDFAARTVADGNVEIQLFAAACQRLASWNGTAARAAIRSGLDRASNPHHRRVLCLTALACRESSVDVGRWLSQSRENAVTKSMLDATNFRPPKVDAAYGRGA